MFKYFKKIFRKKVDIFLRQYLNRVEGMDRMTQIGLSLKFKELFNNKILLSFKDVGFRIFSQNDEDGILHYIFSLIGVSNYKTVEICAGDGVECLSANLIVNHGWNGLLFDGNVNNIKRGQNYYNTCRDTFLYPPKLIHAWIDVGNVNDLVSQNGFSGDIDLLCIDMDGVDYWVWKALHAVKPRVVVVEYNDIMGSDLAVTVPYNKNFMRNQDNLDFCGASLPAFVKLGREKGYRLIGCNRYCFNAFFMRFDVGNDIFPEVSVESCLTHPRTTDASKSRFETLKNFDWEKV